MIEVGAKTIALHPAQATVFKSKKRFRVMVAGRRLGKSVLSIVEIIRASRKSNQLIWYVAPTYQLARDVSWNRLKEMMPKRWVKGTHDTRMEMKLINNTRIALKGAEDFDRLRGVGLNFIVIDEAQDIHADAWNVVLRPTLADTGGSALFIGTPKVATLLHDLWRRGQDERYREWESWTFRTIDSPFIPQSEIDQAMSDMDAKEFAQEFLAEWVTASGRVYHAFKREVHVGDYKFDPSLPIWVGVDFNISPMSAAIMQPHRNTGQVHVVDEISRHDSNTTDLVDALEARYWRYINNVTIYPDPSSNSRQHARGESDLDIFRERGFKKIKFRKKAPFVSDRVNATNRLFENAKGERRLFLDSSCRHTISSLEQTVYKEGSREINKKMSVDHATDALSYCLDFEFPVKRYTLKGVSL